MCGGLHQNRNAGIQTFCPLTIHPKYCLFDFLLSFLLLILKHFRSLIIRPLTVYASFKLSPDEMPDLFLFSLRFTMKTSKGKNRRKNAEKENVESEKSTIEREQDGALTIN